MQIADITCHDVYNFGASLQAYALQRYCQSLGHDYYIINYKPPYLSNHYNLRSVNNPIFDKPLIRELYILAKLPERLCGLKRKHAFDEFTARYLNVGKKRYSSCEELEGDCPQADLYIAGSDQIWNTFFRNGQDPSFYLDFVKGKGRKISYAASFATDRIFNNAESFVKEKLTNFDAIAVRESSGLDLLKSLGYDDSTVTIDPVFLLQKEEWLDLIADKPRVEKNYILVYDCEQSPLVRQIAIAMKEKTGLPIYAVSGIYGKYADEDKGNCGPLDFINAIRDAEYVVANSFHALAFSLIFGKEFFIVNRTEKINTRMRDFLASLDLSSRLIDATAQTSVPKLDFSEIESKLATQIAVSKEYLDRQFSMTKKESK